jgi:hypothetical protein
MAMLKSMNVVVIGVGFESGSARMLRYLKNNTVTVEQNTKALELGKKYKLPIMASFIIGSPTETMDEMKQTLEYIKQQRLNPYFVPLTYLATPFPGTEFWDYVQKEGVAVENYDDYCMDLPKISSQLKQAPLLSKVPFNELYLMTQKFRDENRIARVKSFAYNISSLDRLWCEMRMAVDARQFPPFWGLIRHPFIFIVLCLGLLMETINGCFNRRIFSKNAGT